MRRLTLILTLLVAAVLVPPLSTGAAADVHAGDLSLAPQQADVVVARDVAFAVQSSGAGSHTLAIQTSRTSARAARPSAWVRTRTVSIEQADRLLRFGVGQGRVLCVRVRDITPGGRTDWTPRVCVTRAIDDQRLHRGGGAQVVAGPRWPDGRMTDLGALGHVAIGRVPKAASVGPVSPTSRFPSCRMVGADLGSGTTEAIDRWIGFDRYHAPRRGRVICGSDSYPYPRLGAIAIVPSWVERPVPTTSSPSTSRTGDAWPPEPVVRIYGDLGDVTTTTRTDVRIYLPYEAEAAHPSWDVEVARVGVLSRRGELRWGRAVSDSRSAAVPVGTPRAQVTCARARLVVDGTAGAWSDRRCVVRPFDDRDLVAHGGRVVTDHRYPDGRATVLTGDARLVLRGVPKRVRFGPIYTQIDRPGATCALPRWGIGRPGPNDRARGMSRPDGVTRMGRISPRRGRAVVVGNGVGNECALGGFLVFPRWVKAPNRA